MTQSNRVLWGVSHLKLAIGKQILFDDTEMTIHEGERVGLVGRNGCGKSTFMKIVAGLDDPSEGDIRVGKEVYIAYLPQDIQMPEETTIENYIRQGLSRWTTLLERYEKLSTHSSDHDELEHLLNLHDAWHLDSKIQIMLSALDIPDSKRFCHELSGGEKRRITLARALASEPDLLLLDEPTNHLDVTTIEWIENFLQQYKGACLFVTHDRYFLDRIASRIIELDNGKFYSYIGNYADFLEEKAEREHAEDQEEYRRKKFLRSEIEWVRRSPKARLRRNLGRVKRYDEIAAQNGPQRTGDIDLLIPPAARLGNKTVDLENISYTLENRPLIKNFSFEFSAGQKIGIVGPNGVGKTTLLRLLTGSLLPQKGKVSIAQTVQFNYIDQGKLLLNPSNTVYQEIGEGLEFVQLGNERISIWGYLKRFMFEDERIQTEVGKLSGGEKARLTLAKILKQGGNFLILDEPTNDLDLNSLRLLEEALCDYQGCLIVVSHDRYFLNRICSGIIGFLSQGEIAYHVGDYDNFFEKTHHLLKIEKEPQIESKKEPLFTKKIVKKLSFKEQKEFDSIEERIMEAEENVTSIECAFAAPNFFTKSHLEVTQLQTDYEQAKKEVVRLYERWNTLQRLIESLQQ